ncbi:arginine repressor [Rothia mucilaginosa]|uniref:Arginine repressor n=1 Tax=Rothia mucilaginosa M508 TaxID=563033 RepID=G5ETE8_9MICC|nr:MULTISPECIES: arginine repressor [Rothia]EHB87734.1 arginine repressor [Rothia mucilaginosa M508]MBF1652435.1 arginine repressor [Rothia mucilaginosa]MBF1655243.1 arginine repressor [Rothia sp. (in: high G+C Gram-positive bacteria)]MBF1660363.1 arginine repressor [Rothia mucilaginosa]MBF1665488.1 arginine repressor [Rothia sp. (in: high G+C Gram-positive bacteria)]
MPFPSTKIARQARIVELLQTRRVRSQAELAQYLTDDGMKVTQATLSRDLVEIGAERIRDEGAGLIYAVPNYPARRGGGTAPDARMISLFKELLITAEGSANITVLRTPPGAAQFLASSIDQGGLEAIMGTIAGDDTVIVITRDPNGGAALAESFLDWSAAQ